MTHDREDPRDRQKGESRPETLGASRRALWLARVVLFWELLWPALWPGLGILGFFTVLALTELPILLPRWLHLLLLIAFLVALGLALYRVAKRLTVPNLRAAQRRVERDSGLAHRPLGALGDRLAVGDGDPFAEALWCAHLARMRSALGRIRVGMPRPGLARRDPLALRFLLLVVLVVGLLWAGSTAPDRLVEAALPQFVALAPPAPVSVELWLTPPAYTRLPPIFLRAGDAGAATGMSAAAAAPGPSHPIRVPTGSKLLARLQGGSGVPHLQLGERGIAFQSLDSSTYQLEDQVTAGDRLVVRQGRRVVGQWPITIVPDQPPTIAFAAPPSRTLRSALRLEYNASDDYGLAKVSAEIRRVNPPAGEARQPHQEGGAQSAPADEAPIVRELPLAGGHPKRAHEVSFHDLSAHPWAGLPVAVQLLAQDEPGQVGRSEPFDMLLPERVFNHPIARAIIEQRKILTRDPAKRNDVAGALSAIASEPGLFGGDISAFLALISARARLRLSPEPGSIAAVQKVLWDTALAIEEGHVSLAERDLRDLQRQLMDALERGASDKEIEQLISQLQDAMDRYLQALAEQELGNPDTQEALDSNARRLQFQDLHKLLDRMRDMARGGARDAARQLLAQLQDMLENLRIAADPRAQGRNGASTLMRGMDDLIGRQDRLLQRTFREAQQGGQGVPLQRPGSSSAAEQESLRRVLGELMRRMGELSGQVPDALGHAERAMRDAVDALNRSMPRDAVQAQSRALDRLRQGRQTMRDSLRQRLGAEGDPRDLDAFGPARDPTDRTMPGFGNFDGNDVKIPGFGTIGRAREIQDELRRRAGEHQRPELELEYIDRLLKRF